MEDKTLKPDLRVPEQKTASLSFCDATPKALRSWVNQLPMANIGEMSRQLYYAIIGLNQLFANAQQRLQYLELIREKIHYACNELAKHYLGRSVILPEKQRKVANLTQALQLHLAAGYKLCVLELSEHGGSSGRNRKLLAMAIHRAIGELSGAILRAHQLYYPSPARSWLECHHLFRFASQARIADLQIEDDTLTYGDSSSVSAAYRRLLLLGCARPNQLRQKELAQVFGLFEAWAEHTRCGPDAGSDSLFVVNPERDAPPVYRSLLEDCHGCIGFDTRQLSDMISATLRARRNRQTGTSPLAVPADVTDSLLIHLHQALGVFAKRNFNRVASEGTLEICVGLTATHYFIAGEKPFSEFISGNDNGQYEEENRFILAARRRQDPWSGAHDAGGSGEDRLYSPDTPIAFRGGKDGNGSSRGDRNRPRLYQAHLINTSPGGYCAVWKKDAPASLQAGELVGVREKSSHPWSVAIVRWMRQVPHQGTRVGIELLAPSASPCGVRLIQKVGNSSEYLRGLLLPQINGAGQAATLITPRLPFQSGSRISLLHDGREDHGVLGQKLTATGSISQFELRLQTAELAENGNDPAVSNSGEDEFDSLWPSL